MPGATPIYGFPYPVLGDSPHGPNQIEDLAEAVETQLSAVAAVGAALDARLDKLEGENAYYRQIAAQTPGIIAATWNRQTFPSAVQTSPIITPNGAFSIFTVNRTGWVDIEAGIRCDITDVAAVRYLYGIFPGAAFTTPYSVVTAYEPEAHLNSTNIQVNLTRRFTAGETFAVAINRLGVGGGGGADASTEALGDVNHLAITWRGED